MAKKSFLLVIAALAVILLPVTGRCDSIDTLSGWTGAAIFCFGDMAGSNPGGVSYGQTFRITEGHAQLLNVTFKVLDNISYENPRVMTFQTVLLQWNGSRPVGSPLFTSDPLVTTGPGSGWNSFSVALNGTQVAQGLDYVLVFTATSFLNQIRDDAAMAVVRNTYANGGFVHHWSEYSFSDITASNWSLSSIGTYDLAIDLQYQIVPEPGTLVMLGLGGILLRRRR